MPELFMPTKGTSPAANSGRKSPSAAPAKNYMKCSRCRRIHETCEPKRRVWNERVKQKCNRCKDLGHPCGPPERAPKAKHETHPTLTVTSPLTRSAMDGTGQSVSASFLSTDSLLTQDSTGLQYRVGREAEPPCGFMHSLGDNSDLVLSVDLSPDGGRTKGDPTRPIVPWCTLTSPIAAITFTTISLSSYWTNHGCCKNPSGVHEMLQSFDILMKALSFKYQRSAATIWEEAWTLPSEQRQMVFRTINMLEDVFRTARKHYFTLKENLNRSGYWQEVMHCTNWYDLGLEQELRVPLCTELSRHGTGVLQTHAMPTTAVRPLSDDCLRLQKSISMLWTQLPPPLIEASGLCFSGISAGHIAFFSNDIQLCFALWQTSNIVEEDTHDLLGRSLQHLVTLCPPQELHPHNASTTGHYHSNIPASAGHDSMFDGLDLDVNTTQREDIQYMDSLQRSDFINVATHSTHPSEYGYLHPVLHNPRPP